MSFFGRIGDWLMSFGKKTATFMDPFIKLLIKSGGEVLMEIALEAVKTMATTQMTNADKREAAVKQIMIMAQEKGLQAGENAIRGTLEMALAKLKGQ